MKSREDEIVDAIFRARMLQEHNVDPGTNWREPGVIFYAFYVVLGLFALKAFFAS